SRSQSSFSWVVSCVRRSSVVATVRQRTACAGQARPPAVAGTRVAAMAVDRSTMWPYEDGEPGRFYYQRYGHPAGVEAEAELSRLDGGQALLFPSGAGATTAVALAFLASGDTIALAAGAYFGT